MIAESASAPWGAVEILDAWGNQVPPDAAEAWRSGADMASVVTQFHRTSSRCGQTSAELVATMDRVAITSGAVAR